MFTPELVALAVIYLYIFMHACIYTDYIGLKTDMPQTQQRVNKTLRKWMEWVLRKQLFLSFHCTHCVIYCLCFL